MVYTYSIVFVLGICLILLLGLIIQKKKEDSRRRKEMEFLSAQRRLEESREKLANLRKILYEVENQLTTNRHYYNTKKEELVQLAKELSKVEEEKNDIQKKIDNGVSTEQEQNLLNNRLKLNRERLAELQGDAQAMQEEVDSLGRSAMENEAEIKKLQHAITQSENELEYNRELVKLKERMMKD